MTVILGGTEHFIQDIRWELFFSPSPSSCSMASVFIIARITRIFTIFYLPWLLIRLWYRFSKVIRMIIDDCYFLSDQPFDAY